MSKDRKHIIIIGAGFGGLYSAKELLKGNKNYKVTIIDSRNFHLFQPLLYQVATAQLAPEDIAYPIRAIFEKNKNITVLKEKVSSVDLDNMFINVDCGKLYYDKLIISVGVIPEYFGNANWQEVAPPLKTLEDALKIRRKILNVFERAESEMLHPCDENPLNFVVIGGGPTGIELSGALAELSKYTLKNEFRKIKPERAKIYLIEAGNSILNGFPKKLQLAAKKSLENLGITIKSNSKVIKIDAVKVEIETNGSTEIIESKVVLWAAGVKGNFANSILSTNNNIKFDKKGRVLVENNLTIPNYRDVYVVGDFANIADEKGMPLPGTAPVAMQQGTFAAKHIKGKSSKEFKYFNKGSLAVIGRNAAVADFGTFHISGFFAWVLWVVVHIGYLIGFNNRVLVLIKWAWSYFVRKSTSRIIYRSDMRSLRK
ncbi:MAG: NAD(P)/FAD-dependent oxidoreductase [Melioribacteraceae bacterium]|nr:NAD(P)/FAD-dependent oxidoreductase [Melioribacteraceae bacterium]